MLIFKIASAREWRAAFALGRFNGSAADAADGYIHFSTAAQAPGTAAKWFAGQSDLMVGAVDAEKLGDALRWEPARGGELFPHLYGSLAMSAVRWTRPLQPGRDGGFDLGDLAQ